MTIIDRIKNFFKKENSGIIRSDNSTLMIPNMRDLSRENQKYVKSLASEINMDNHLSTVKYSEDLAQRTNMYLDILYKVVSEMDDAFQALQSLKNRIKNKDRDNNYFYEKELSKALGDISLLESEAELLKQEIAKSDIYATLKTIAFKEFIKSEIRKKKNPLKVFVLAGDIEKSVRMLKLSSEYERLLNSIKIIRTNLYSSSLFSTITKYSSIINELKDYNNGKLNIDYINKALIELNQINNEFADNTVEQPTKDEMNVYSIPGWGSIYGIENYNSEVYKKLINRLAKYRFELDKHLHNHRYDYKDILEKIRKTNAHYDSINPKNRDVTELRYDIEFFNNIIKNYIFACRKYIHEGIIRELKEELFNLAFKMFYYDGITCSAFEYNEFNKMLLDRFNQLFDEFISNNINPKYAGRLKRYLNDKEPYINKPIKYQYVYLPLIKLLLKLKNEDLDESHKEMNGITIIAKNNKMHVPEDRSTVNNNGIYYNFDKYFRNIKNNENEDLWDFETYGGCSIEDFYYALRVAGYDDNFINSEMFKSRYGSTLGIESFIKEIIIKYQFNKYSKQYDDRILVLPKRMHIKKCEEDFYVKRHENSSSLIAMYVDSFSQLEDVSSLQDEYHRIRYLLVKQSTMNEFSTDLGRYYRRISGISSYGWFGFGMDELYGRVDNQINKAKKLINGTSRFKIIVVPDNVKYSELSEYLDEELNKEKNESYRRVLAI